MFQIHVHDKKKFKEKKRYYILKTFLNVMIKNIKILKCIISLNFLSRYKLAIIFTKTFS